MDLSEDLTDAAVMRCLILSSILLAAVLSNAQKIIKMLQTASNTESEQRLAYFREDLGLNSHHWHWHKVYPTNGTNAQVDKDRRGELFYYFHDQIVARYDSERLCNNLSRVIPYEKWHEPIREAYYPKLDRLVASKIWASRTENLTLKNIPTNSVKNLTIWRNRIYTAIHSGILKSCNGTGINLTEVNGIDVLGNTVEVNNMAPNIDYYGNLHGVGHRLMGRIHDPRGIYLEETSVMGTSGSGVSMRDPLFYRWHKFIDKIFVDFKKKLPPYTTDDLSNPGVTVDSIEVTSSSGTNQLLTFWQNAAVNMTRGVDFVKAHSVRINITFLNHIDFQYNIQATSDQVRQATCRIFISPKYNELGDPWLLRDQKDMFIELDTFPVNLTAGVNKIIRYSTNSSVTIPFSQSYRDLQTNRPNDTDIDQFSKFIFCGCGWPHNLLIPKGNEAGVPFQLFVMLSNMEGDILTNTTMHLPTENKSGELCVQAFSQCGLKDKLYPDARPMKYPFDRFPNEQTLDKFLTPNMKVVDITIFHKNITKTAK